MLQVEECISLEKPKTNGSKIKVPIGNHHVSAPGVENPPTGLQKDVRHKEQLVPSVVLLIIGLASAKLKMAKRKEDILDIPQRNSINFLKRKTIFMQRKSMKEKRTHRMNLLKKIVLSDM